MGRPGGDEPLFCHLVYYVCSHNRGLRGRWKYFSRLVQLKNGCESRNDGIHFDYDLGMQSLRVDHRVANGSDGSVAFFADLGLFVGCFRCRGRYFGRGDRSCDCLARVVGSVDLCQWRKIA